MDECKINSVFRSIPEAIECRDKLEKETNRPLRIVEGPLYPFSRLISGYAVVKFAFGCTTETRFGANEYEARECAEALTRLTGKEHGVFKATCFICNSNYGVTSDPMDFDNSYYQ